MEWIGEIERLIATNLYPLRVPIAAGLLVGLVALMLFARRRGWFAAARRHPARTTVLVVALLAVGLPTGWYLGSPLFIRTSLVEPAPSIPIATQAPSESPDVTPSIPPATDVPLPAVTTPPLAAARTGMFTGEDDFHFGSGTASLIETAPGTWVLRFEDFSVRNGPDLYVYLSPDAEGYAEGAIELGTLKATDGSFNHEVPAGTDVHSVRSVVIWCKQFAVQFAVAPLG
ncbi:MAG: DM13 domain-containing protein [Chloroflexota bacterium]